MVTPDGLVKILDFGLAKLEPAAEPGGSQIETVARETKTGVVLGTVGYMSPEQATGRPVDFRSDQFAFGAILFELAAGRRAFAGPSAVEALSAIVRDEPPSLETVRPDAPAGLARIVARCLAKNPHERYGSTADLARDLRDLAAGPSVVLPATATRRAPPRSLRIAIAGLLVMIAAVATWWVINRRPAIAPAEHSLAVLPFQRVGPEAEEYFSDGITDALTTDLARVRGLLVIARNSAFAYKNRNADLRSVARDLHVRYVLSGSVQRAGGSVRVTAQLVDANTGYPVWADRYDREMKDVFAVEDDISGHIVRALKVALASSGAAPGSTRNVEAYDAFLRGLYVFHQFAWVEKDKSIPWFEKAVALDPAFAAAHGALASAFAKKAFEGDPGGTWTTRANAEIEKALALDPNLDGAFLARGTLAWRRENGFPHERAAADFRRAIAANPNSDAAHASLASLLYHVGLMDESLAEYRAALRINPRQLDYLYRIPRIHLYQQKYSLALEEFEAEPR
ncbi:MAG TPA: protein kinase, partial [Candidatus Eisenbacteria bacterium]